MLYLLLLALLWLTTPVLAEGFRCAGSQGAPTEEALPAGVAAKPTRITANTTGTRRALVLFARFKGDPANPVPVWAADLLKPDLPGSISHFYDTMSFGKLQLRGVVGPRVYESAQPASAYLASDPSEQGRFGQFTQEILAQADQDLDLAQFDNDGPDGVPNSGDDDGVVDVVFLVLERIPAGFLLAEATGIGDLGFSGGYDSRDIGKDGSAIAVRGERGTIQQGRYFAETVGSICHEYGHVLGLPDLYNTEFLRTAGAGPEEDSAGVGAWCLMGWGATGWNGNDGPNSFCAWSRVQLGWAEVATPAQEFQELHLQEVGAKGSVFKVPLHHDEHFLVEYRRRTSTYYDRNIPAEGLLIWHVTATGLDLECADGRWQDAGYPQGETAHPRTGGDNLDFWAHDGVYAQAHGGNLGDATDPFDGARFTSFTPRSNPSSYSADGRLSVRIEGMHFEGDTALAQVQALPLKASTRNLTLRAEGSGQVLLAGERIQVTFVVTNEGGAPLEKVRVQLRSDDPLVEVVRAEVDFGNLDPGETTARYASGAVENLSFRFTTGFAGVHTAHLVLDTFADGTLTGQLPFEASGLSPRQEVRAIAVVDSTGNGDGQAQGGEIIRLRVALAGEPGVLQEYLHFSFRPLGPGMVLIGSPEARFDASGSLVSPEMVVPAGLAPGTRLEFQLLSLSQYSTWADTLAIELQPGPDQTPPRILSLGSSSGSEGFRLVLAESNLLDGSGLTRVYAVVYTRKDTTRIVTVPLNYTGHRYEGFWPEEEEGEYLIEVVATDAAGNVGRSALQEFEIFLRQGEGAGSIASRWEALPFPSQEHLLSNANLHLAPGDSGGIYLSVSQGIWHSVDGGRSWVGVAMTGWLVGAGMLVDPQDLQVLYLKGSYPLKSSDGRQHWQPAFPDLGVVLLATDPLDPERLYGTRDGWLVISADGGRSWTATSIQPRAVIRVHPRDPQVLYAGALSDYDTKQGTTPGTLHRSGDGGQTWDSWKLDQVFTDLVLDPQVPERLYATAQGTAWVSTDSGKKWQVLPGFELAGGLPAIGLAAGTGGNLVVWDLAGKVLRQSQDGGQSWTPRVLPQGAAGRIVLDPRDPQHFMMIAIAQGWLYQSYDGGLNWESYPLPQVNPPAGTLAFDAAGRLLASAARQTSQGQVNGLFSSDNRGSTWRQLGREGQLNGFVEGLYADPYDVQFLVTRAASGYAIIEGANQSRWMFAPYLGFTTAYPEIVVSPQRRGVYYLAELGVWRVSPADDGYLTQTRSTGLPQVLDSRRVVRYTPEISGLAIDPGNPATLYAAIGDSLWRTQDEGQHWEYYNQVGEGGTIYALHRHPLQANKLYAATEGGLYLSQDEGRNWALLARPEIRGPRKMRLRFDTHDPQRILWITGTQLLESEDGGRTWYSLTEGLAGLPWINDAAYDPQDPALIYAATAWGVYRLDTYQPETAVGEAQLTPVVFALHPNYPNPFNPSTTIRFSLPRAGEAELCIYNLMGQRVATLMYGVQEAGPHVLQWNGRDEQGRELASGVYFYRLQAGGRVETRKLLLLR
ncbi:MAG: T9SS type A sorting domain-containing protein [Candidatus Latescibacteria bacterium]|nr:T9SS type A sorting domain-containing protein [Candidatus Latescibacterota bacterium]